ncbi:phosphoribosylglycinamide formyltransferase [bacterium]|nr:phosphoribosylglycinamide formyltransferase [bacterium]
MNNADAPSRNLNLGIFASGRGSNFQAILDAIRRRELDARVRLLVTNNPEAGAVGIARSCGAALSVLRKGDFGKEDEFAQAMLETLRLNEVDFIALAGYLKMIPVQVITAYRHRILNIHPALLPAFGGKGMYGHHVHEAVLAAGCKVSGATVHMVDEIYDHGPIVAQRCVPVLEGDTPDSLAARILETEHEIYPAALQLFAQGRVAVRDGRAVVACGF